MPKGHRVQDLSDVTPFTKPEYLIMMGNETPNSSEGLMLSDEKKQKIRRQQRVASCILCLVNASLCSLASRFVTRLVKVLGG